MSIPYRILIAEDDAQQCALLTRIITSIYPAANVTSVADGEAALTGYLAQGADVIITDQQMPGLTGSTLIQRVRAGNATIPVILLSGLIASSMTSPGKHTYYLQKPVNLQELAYVLQHALSV